MSSRRELPNTTTAGWRYRRWIRNVLVVLPFFVLLASFLVNLIWVGVVLFLALTPLSLAARNGRTFLYMEAVAAWLSLKLSRRGGRLAKTSVKAVLYEDDRDDISRTGASPVRVNFLSLDSGPYERGRDYVTEVQTPDNGLHTMYVLFDHMGKLVVGNRQDLADQQQAFGEILRLLANNYGPGLHVRLFSIPARYDFVSQLQWTMSSWVDEDYPNKAMLERNNLEAFDAITKDSISFLTGVSISTRRPKGWNKIEPDQIRVRDIVQSDCYRLSETLIQLLEQFGATNVRRPNPYEMTVLLRGSLDVTLQDELYRARYEDEAKLSHDDFKMLDDSMTLQLGVFPFEDEFVLKHDYLRVSERTYSRTYHVPAFMQDTVEADTLQHLYDQATAIGATVTVGYRVANAREEQKHHNFRRREMRRKQLSRQEKGEFETAKDRAETERVLAEEERLYETGGDTVHIIMLLSISATSLDDLEEASEELRLLFQQSLLELEAVRGTAAQIVAKMEAIGIPAAF